MKVKYELHSEAIIRRFRDGDTIEVLVRCDRCAQWSEETIRLPRIESWERIGPTSAKASTTAAALTHQYQGISGRLIPGQSRRDKYGRLIADIEIGGILLSAAIVQAGWAWYGVGNHAEDHRGLPSE